MTELDHGMLRKRSAPIIVRDDGTADWDNQNYPSEGAAQDARRAYRAITFGMIYGGSGNIMAKQAALDELESLRALALKYNFVLVPDDTYTVMQADYIEKYGEAGHGKTNSVP